VDVKGADGTVTNWMVEAGSPNVLLRRGFTKQSVAPGTAVVIDGYQSKDGSSRMNGRDITLPADRNSSLVLRALAHRKKKRSNDAEATARSGGARRVYSPAGFGGATRATELERHHIWTCPHVHQRSRALQEAVRRCPRRQITNAGSLELIKFPGAMVIVSKTRVAPTEGSDGSVLHNFTMKVKDLADLKPKLVAAGATLISEKKDEALMMFPEKVQVEFVQDASVKQPVMFRNVQVNSVDPPNCAPGT